MRDLADMDPISKRVLWEWIDVMELGDCFTFKGFSSKLGGFAGNKAKQAQGVGVVISKSVEDPDDIRLPLRFAELIRYPKIVDKRLSWLDPEFHPMRLWPGSSRIYTKINRELLEF